MPLYAYFTPDNPALAGVVAAALLLVIVGAAVGVLVSEAHERLNRILGRDRNDDND